jgi:hypothetical protein
VLVPTVVVWVWLIAENANNVSKRNGALVLVIFFEPVHRIRRLNTQLHYLPGRGGCLERNL